MGFGLSAPFMFDALNAVTTSLVYDVRNNLPLTLFIRTLVCILNIDCSLFK